MINKLHEWLLRTTLNEYSSNFKILLGNKNDICNHHGNIQAFLTEVFKMKPELAPPIIESILYEKLNTYNLRSTFTNLRRKEK